MLSSDEHTTASREADLQWVREQMRLRNIEGDIFEKNDFVHEYARELRRLVEHQEARYKATIDSMQRQLWNLNSSSSREEAAMKLLGMDSSLANDLVELSIICGVKYPSVPELSLSLDKTSQVMLSFTKSVAELEQLSQSAITLASDMKDLNDGFTKAKEEFDLWARRDCELGIKELQTATETVLLKKVEYVERLDQLNARWSDVSGGVKSSWRATPLRAMLEQIVGKRKQLQQVQEALEPFNQLPPDMSLASIKLEEAKQELRRLMAQRDVILRSYR